MSVGSVKSSKNIFHLDYRSDIDGLRGLAVIAVVFFHGFPKILHGGFVGVDIFFVISGFLVGTIIAKNLEQGTFSFADFYARRINRLFPALLVTMIAAAAFGWFALLQSEYKLLGKHIAGASTFISNFVLLYEAGYFDVSAEFKPLLHLWSLSIEEQFYFFWPLLSFFIWKKKKLFLPLCFFLCLSSFAYGIYVLKENPSLAYYSPFARIWEILLGVLWAQLWMRRFDEKLRIPFTWLIKNKNFVSVGGLFLALLSISFTTKDGFPGFQALVPTLGAVLLIAAGPEALINKSFFSNRFLGWVGKISYPLYLWHWILLSYARILYGGQLTSAGSFAVLIFSFALAHATTEWIEKPFRGRSSSKFKTAFLVIGLFAIGIVGINLYLKEGLPQRPIVLKNNTSVIDPKNQPQFKSNREVSCISEMKNHKLEPDNCVRYLASSTSRPSVVVWGDSSSGAWSSVFRELGFEYDLNVTIISLPGCTPILGTRASVAGVIEKKLNCSGTQLSDDVLSLISLQKPKVIILIGAWNSFTPGLTNEDKPEIAEVLRKQVPLTLLRLEKIAKLVVFKSWPVRPDKYNYPVDRVRFLQPKQWTPRRVTRADHEAESKLINDIFTNTPTTQTTFVDPAEIVCDSECRTEVDGYKMYLDDYHITPQGALLLKPKLLSVLSELQVL